VRLARTMLERQARDLSKSIAGSVPLLLSASPYINSDDLTDMLLQLSFRAACFGEGDAPRARTAYELAVDRGRERLYASLEEASAMTSRWLRRGAERTANRWTILAFGCHPTPPRKPANTCAGCWILVWCKACRRNGCANCRVT